MKNYILTAIFSFFIQIICLGGNQSLLTKQDFLKMWKNKGKPFAEGSFGNIYIVELNGQQYALKQMKNADNSEDDIQGNNMLFSGIKKLKEDNPFYKKNIHSLTWYYGDFKTPENETILVFEYAPGVSFESYLKNLNPEERYSKNTFYEISAILAKYANLIHLEHEAGVINRDVKAQNFHIQKQASSFSIKGLDHGTMLKLTAIDNGEQRTKGGVGTPARMAPEITTRNIREKGYSPAVDVFALGCELLNAYFNFFDKQFFAQSWDITSFLENAEPFQRLPNWEGFFTQALLENKSKENIINLCLERLKVLSNVQQEFLGYLIKDCCTFNPEHRLSAAQLGYLLEIFSQSFKNNDIISYKEQKEIALKTYPLSIPRPIILMIQNSQTKLNGYVALNLLIHSNFSYKYTETYQELLKHNDFIEFNSKAQLLSYLVLGDIEKFHILASALVDVVQKIKETICLENFPILNKNKTIPMPANIILNLGRADIDFQKQEVYGMTLLQKGDEQILQKWASQNKNVIKTLIQEGFLKEFPIINTKKTIPLSTDMIVNLGKINKSFQKQEIYGMALLQKGDEQTLQNWANRNKNIVKTLIKKAFIADSLVIDFSKTIPMSPDMVLNLGKINTGFQKQEIYGWALWKTNKMDEFNKWCFENPNNELSKQKLQWHTIE